MFRLQRKVLHDKNGFNITKMETHILPILANVSRYSYGSIFLSAMANSSKEILLHGPGSRSSCRVSIRSQSRWRGTSGIRSDRGPQRVRSCRRVDPDLGSRSSQGWSTRPWSRTRARRSPSCCLCEGKEDHSVDIRPCSSLILSHATTSLLLVKCAVLGSLSNNCSGEILWQSNCIPFAYILSNQSIYVS